MGTCFIVFQFSWHEDGCIGVKSLASPWRAFSKLSYLGSRCLTIVIKSFEIGLSGDGITIEGTDKIPCDLYVGYTPLLLGYVIN